MYRGCEQPRRHFTVTTFKQRSKRYVNRPQVRREVPGNNENRAILRADVFAVSFV